MSEDIANVARAAGDPLESCECPVCTRIKRVIEGIGQSYDIGDVVSIAIAEDRSGGPEDGPGLGRPNLDESEGLPTCEAGPDAGERTTNDREKNMADTKGRGLYVVGRFAWTGDGRWA